MVYRRSLSRVDFPAFNQQLYAADWLPVFAAPTTDTKWDRFQRILISQLDTVAPLRRVRERRPAAVPVTPETRQLLRDRRAALGSADRAEYKRLNRLCRAAVRADCRARYEGELARSGRAALWRVLRPVIGRKQQQQCTVPNITPDALNDYYVTVGPSTSASVPAPATPVTTVLPRVLTCSFRVGPVSMDELYSALMSMKPSSSTGLDGISVHMLQRCFTGLSHTLLDVVNSSLSSGCVPSGWKHALVTPIPKGKISADPSDTRPISLLPAIMKIVERVVQCQLTGYLEQHALLADAQHGYRKCRSTETALHVVTDRVLCAMDH
ncbi:uncharacterized protein LOC122375471 [Amphibalanus amphitrite]|uniref:uncharacterized protein LOC122375471 n=1 Tax=Amphibalanus amphitrite TaxID=1232801 RepID=UPI001C9267A4|nr:uncharacterized protein LOC122375471 [Amphibalanus amphitrite]